MINVWRTVCEWFPKQTSVEDDCSALSEGAVPSETNSATENHNFFKECNDILAEIYFKITKPKHIMVTDMYEEFSKGNSILLRLDASLIFANSE